MLKVVFSVLSRLWTFAFLVGDFFNHHSEMISHDPG